MPVTPGSPGASPLNLKSLREQVYEHLRAEIEAGSLRPGSFLDQDGIAAELGTSRTPLRDALIQLETEGFVEILPRRGVVIRSLRLDDVRHLYEIIGALEGAALLSVAARLGPGERARMRDLNAEMGAALDAADFDAYYERNLAFHDVFLARSDNRELRRTVRVCRQRLYDFPRERAFVAEWERRSTREHEELVVLLAAGDARGAADFLRDVHWSFEVQKPFLLRYHHMESEAEGGGA
jgi:DNA-binding GntR family transcriptional regulator